MYICSNQSQFLYELKIEVRYGSFAIWYVHRLPDGILFYAPFWVHLIVMLASGCTSLITYAK